MADFCKSCSIEMFGKDHGDLKNLGGKDAEPLQPGFGYQALCENCGPILVDEEGAKIETEEK